MTREETRYRVKMMMRYIAEAWREANELGALCSANAERADRLSRAHEKLYSFLWDPKNWEARS